MSDQPENQGSASEPDPAPEPDSGPAPQFDDDGLPLHREATLDDVRGNAGSGRAIAVGCFVFVAAAILLFWIVRGGILG